VLRSGHAVPKAEEALNLDKASLESKKKSHHLEVSTDFSIALVVLQSFHDDFHTVVIFLQDD